MDTGGSGHLVRALLSRLLSDQLRPGSRESVNPECEFLPYALAMPFARVMVTLPADLVENIDRIERSRSAFVLAAVRRGLQRRRSAQLRRSLVAPHPQARKLAEAGLEAWAGGLPEEEVRGLVDPQAGRAVRWVAGRGWVQDKRRDWRAARRASLRGRQRPGYRRGAALSPALRGLDHRHSGCRRALPAARPRIQRAAPALLYPHRPPALGRQNPLRCVYGPISPEELQAIHLGLRMYLDLDDGAGGASASQPAILSRASNGSLRAAADARPGARRASRACRQCPGQPGRIPPQPTAGRHVSF